MLSIQESATGDSKINGLRVSNVVLHFLEDCRNVALVVYLNVDVLG